MSDLDLDHGPPRPPGLPAPRPDGHMVHAMIRELNALAAADRIGAVLCTVDADGGLHLAVMVDGRHEAIAAYAADKVAEGMDIIAGQLAPYRRT